ncbi:hypothetical protein WCD74_13600 [Actinomycetospora sp. OC33-EN08]|uniref:Antitoxin n=1 Tax=Actinomycetospora aurantiaca TaxID=3129233 RepID=A0ABU8MNA5_9PSEU
MSIDLGRAEAVVREQAARAGVPVERWVLRLAAEHSAREHAAWHRDNPGVLEAELAEVEAARLAD